MSDTPQNNDDQALAGEYALGLMSAEEAKAFEARMASDPALRAAYAQWAEDFARLTDDIAPQAPPERVKARLEKTLFAPPPAAKPSLAERFGLRNLYSLLFVAGVAMIWLFVDLPPRPAYPPENPVYHADLAATEGGDIILAAGFDATTSELYVERRGAKDRPGRDIELWLIAGDNPPVSLGVLSEEDRMRLPISPELVAALEGGVLAISDEPQGGSPTGAPTGDVLATGPLTNV